MPKRRTSRFHLPAFPHIPRPDFSGLNKQTLSRAALALGWLLFLSSLVVGWILYVPALAARADAASAVPPESVKIEFLHPPEWFQGDLAQTLIRTAELQITGSSLAREDLALIRDVLLNTGWFTSIAQVRRISPTLIQITADFATPCTFVRDDSGDHLIDPTGILLPKTDPAGFHADCIVLASPHFARPARPGQQWDGADIAAGLSLLKVIYNKPWAKQIREIDLSNYNRNSSLSLLTDKSSLIVWGAAPGDAAPLEATTSEKLHRLDLLFQTYKRIDANLNGTLDLTPQDGVFKRPDLNSATPPPQR